MLNFGLMKNPLNWIIVTLMVLIAAIVLHQAVSILKGRQPDA